MMINNNKENFYYKRPIKYLTPAEIANLKKNMFY